MLTEKSHDIIEPALSSDNVSVEKVDLENDGEIFKRGEGYEDFRTVGWIQTTIIFTKSTLGFRSSILNPGAVHICVCHNVIVTDQCLA